MGISKIGPNVFFIKARVKVPNPDPRERPDDRRKQETFEGSKHAAEERYLEIKKDLRGERARAGTFGHLLDAYKTSRGGTIPRSQRSVYESLMRDLGKVDTNPARLEAALRQYAVLLMRFPSKTTGKLLAAGTRNRFRAMVGAALNLGILTKDIPAPSPLTKAIWPKAKEIPRDRRLEPQEVDRIMAAVDRLNPHLRPIFWYALRVPCRKSELVRMGHHDLDLFNDLIRVENGSTKSKKGCWKPIPPEMKDYFRAVPPESPTLFFRREGDQYCPIGDFKKAWKSCLRAANISDFRFHDTRHIAATNLVNAGMTERDVMKIAGWDTNMLSTYWGSSSMESAKRATFLPGSAVAGGNIGATLQEGAEKVGDLRTERAVS
ncbi:MAG: site-specific integrase [Fibrobacteria bacterium]